MDLFDATIDGYTLELEHIDDSFEKSIVRHEFPYRDGALLEDLGQKARTVRFRAYFWDDGADHFTYADHVDFLNHLKSTALSELVHPMYGPLTGCVESVSARHDDRQMTAEVDFTFVENLRDATPDVAYEEVAGAAEGAFLSGEDEQQAELAAGLAEELGESRGFMAEELDPAKSLYEQFAGGAKYAREVVKEVDVCVTAFQAAVVEVTNPVNSLIATIAYAESLPGRVIGAVSRAVERTALLVTSTVAAPARIITNLDLELTRLEQAFLSFSPSSTRAGVAVRAAIGRALSVACARRLALEAAYVYRDDESLRNQLRRTETATSFDLLGRYTPAAQSDAVMNVRELEATLAAVRARLQAAIDAARAVQSQKDLARILLDHVGTVKLERERIVTVLLDNPLPLHLACLKYRLPYNYAERIATINRLPNPTFAAGELAIYALAGGAA
jgi:prophage DNA circulation protein